ncbi:hypothetical protein [Caulobacter sp. X]|uniref:hypothetical protein n=1 Tax=Caulobacter sp. X TaxID=2048901 RepID=UPI001178973A|nr:hypothetical protein [Caulobacter sp. X]
MKRLASLVTAGLAIGLAMVSTTASAEEAIAGLKLGAPREDVRRAFGFQVSVARISDGWGDEIMFEPHGFQVQLCDGRAVSITEHLPGGVHEFARLAKNETAARGPAQLNPLNGVSAQGETSTVAAEWPVANGLFRLTLSSDPTGQLSISRQLHWNKTCGKSPKE